MYPNQPFQGPPQPQAGYGPPPSQAGYGPPPPQAGYPPPPPQAGYGPPPLQAGYGPPPHQAGYGPPPPPPQQQTTTIINTQPQLAVVPGGCICGGMVSDNFTICGIVLAICFFPLGVLCCFFLMEKRCSRCGRVF